MGIENAHILATVAIGLGATLVMDLWALFLRRAFGVSSLNYCLVGRWLHHMPEGTFRHTNIAAAPKKSAECVTGWIAHYLIGIAFAFMLVAATLGRWLENPTLLPALGMGVSTVLFPFLIMQPSLGLGVAASRTPSPTRTRLKSLMSHSVFGVGLYFSAFPVSYLMCTYT